MSSVKPAGEADRGAGFMSTPTSNPPGGIFPTSESLPERRREGLPRNMGSAAAGTPASSGSASGQQCFHGAHAMGPTPTPAWFYPAMEQKVSVKTRGSSPAGQDWGQQEALAAGVWLGPVQSRDAHWVRFLMMFSDDPLYPDPK